MTQPPSGSLPDPNAPDSSNMGGSFNTGNPYNPDYTNPSYSSPDASASAYPQGGQSFAAGQPFPASVQPVWTSGAPQGPKTSKRGPLIMLISGIVAMIILGPVLMVVGMAGSFSKGVDVQTISSTGGEVSLEAGTSYSIYVAGEMDSCDVYSPDYSDIDVNTNVTEFVADDHKLVATFTSEESGTYDLYCSTDNNTDIWVGPEVNEGDFMAAGLGMIGGMLVSFIGLVLTIVGTVWLVKRSKAKKALENSHPGAYPGGMPTQGGYVAPPQAQPGYPAAPQPPTGYPSAPTDPGQQPPTSHS